jgi:hypothetical protein
MDPVVILGSESVSVGPGQEQRLPVRIRNQGRRVESFRVDVVGAPESFAEVVPPVVSVLPGREAEIDVIFRPPGGASTPTGSLPFAVRATSEVDASSSAVAEGRLDLAGVAGLQAWAQETSRAGRWSVRYHLEFANQGNAAVRLALTAHDPAGATKLRLSPDVIDLSPGGRSTAQLKTTTRHPFLRGSKVNRNLQVACQTFPFGVERPAPGAPPPQGDPNHRTFQLSFEQRPILPKFAIPLLVLALAVLIALAVLKLRQGETFALDLTAPLSPTGVEATATGSSSITLHWIDVPNAEGYEVRQVSVAGGEADEVLAPALPPDQNTFTAEELLPATEYCFAVKALGPEERASALSDDACATTGEPTTLAPPSEVFAAPEGGDRYQVTWTNPPESEGVQYVIFVGGAPAEGPVPGSPVVIELPADDAEQTARIQVQAIRGDQQSELSQPPFELVIPALPPETVPPTPPPTDSPATTLGAETTVAPTTVPGGLPTDTGPPSTAPSPTAELLQNLPPTWAAVFVGLPPQGGETFDDRKDRIAQIFSIPLDQLADFTNRDTVAHLPDGSPSILARAAPETRFIYFATGDQAGAEGICSTATENCDVFQLTGAAKASEETPIMVLERLRANVSLTALDERLRALRGVDALDSDDVHVLNGSTYPQFRTTSPVVFVSDPTIFGDVEAFCAAEEMTCTLELLQRSG